jgi:hypothetical protein
VWRRKVGDERVARGVADALADAIDEPRRDHPTNRCGKREDRLGERRQAIAERRQELAMAEPVGQGAGISGDKGLRAPDTRCDIGLGEARGFAQDGEIVGEHRRRFGRGHTIYNPWANKGIH